MTNADRAGDRDREKTAARLGQALAQGYLQMDEYDERVQATFQANTTAELKELLQDLPIERIRRADPQRRKARAQAARRAVRIHFAGFLAMALIVLTVWAAIAITTNVFYFWAIWPILGGVIGLISHATAIPKHAA